MWSEDLDKQIAVPSLLYSRLTRFCQILSGGKETDGFEKSREPSVGSEYLGLRPEMFRGSRVFMSKIGLYT